MNWKQLYARFTVGEEAVVIEARVSWSGLQVYTANGVEVARRRSFWPNDTVCFTVGDAVRHAVRIELKTIPPSTRVYVDGALFLDPLFPEISFQKPKQAPAGGTPQPLETPPGRAQKWTFFETLLSVFVASFMGAVVVRTWPNEVGLPDALVFILGGGIGGAVAGWGVGASRKWKAFRRARGNADAGEE